MKDLIRRIKENTTNYCVTVSMNTHRTLPDRHKDEILLKNMISEAEIKVANKFGSDKKAVESIKSNLAKTVAKIDFSKNLDSIVLFVNENEGRFVTLPVKVEDRVSVCDSFMVRSVVRAVYSSMHYYIFYLSMKEVNMFKVYNDAPAVAYGSPFPLIYAPKIEKDHSTREKKLKENFLNNADKELDKVVRSNMLPVVACGNASTYGDFQKEADRKDRFIGLFNFDYEFTPNADVLIAKEAWKVVKEYNKKVNAERISEVERAIDSGRFTTDLSQILVASSKGGKLYVKSELFIPVVVKNGLVSPVGHDQRDNPGVIDDIISEFIINVIKGGGEVIFISGSALDKYNGVVYVG